MGKTFNNRRYLASTSILQSTNTLADSYSALHRATYIQYRTPITMSGPYIEKFEPTITPPQGRELKGGDVLAQTLKQLGVEVAFGLHGGHLDAFLMAADDIGIKLVDTRHETVAVQAAEGYNKVKNRVGVCFVTASTCDPRSPTCRWTWPRFRSSEMGGHKHHAWPNFKCPRPVQHQGYSRRRT